MEKNPRSLRSNHWSFNLLFDHQHLRWISRQKRQSLSWISPQHSSISSHVFRSNISLSNLSIIKSSNKISINDRIISTRKNLLDFSFSSLWWWSSKGYFRHFTTMWKTFNISTVKIYTKELKMRYTPRMNRMIVENQGLQQLWTLYKLAARVDNRISAGWTIRNCLASIEVCMDRKEVNSCPYVCRIMEN